MFRENIKRSNEIRSLLLEKGFLNNEISFAVIDLFAPQSEIFGYNMDHFIYPASVYKIFIGAEVLRRIEIGELDFNQNIEIQSLNDVDKDIRIFPGDTRKLLHAKDTVTIEHLIDLMLIRSDNTASNTLIDLVGRESINQNIISTYNWQGSGITRKFLNRTKEDKPYQFAKTTLSCARHLAQFFYLVESKQLISPFVSEKLKGYMLKSNRSGDKGLWLKDQYVEYYRKGGWLETNLYKYGFLSACKSIFKKGWAIIRYSNDAGVVTGNNSKYVITLLTINKSILPNKYFNIKEFARCVHEYMETRNK